MGFFSAVKKFFGQGTADSPDKSREAPENKTPAAVSPQAAQPVEQIETVKPVEEPPAAADISRQKIAEPKEELATQSQEPPGQEGAQDAEQVNPAGGESIEAVGASAKAAGDSANLDVKEQTRTAADDALLLQLRQAEPRLSSWQAIILEGQDEVDEEFWRRLRFLLTSLQAPPQEIDKFVSDFAHWLQRMEYSHVDEFQSELQYRLALALDMEDEEDERNRLVLKLGESLAATRARFGKGLEELFSGHARLDETFWEEMEELFITADMGYETSMEIVARLKKRADAAKIAEPEKVRDLLRLELEEIFRQTPKIRAANKPEVVLMMGVNGAGKTTTIAKLAYRDQLNGKKVLVVAGDTFRAAAMEQLKVWSERVGASFYARPAGADPASVAWEAMDFALANDIDVVYVDTAGRLQTRVNLMEELGKIKQVLGKKHPGAPHRHVLVLDATTGQNALSQAKLFREASGADEIILTKLDGTAKGGVAIAVAMAESLPITFIGLGEKMEDLRPFNGSDFANAILGKSI